MRKKANVCALILAAGSSSRMGSFKPLLPLGKSTALEEAIGSFLKATVQDVKVVVGYKAALITPVLDRLGIQWVLNRQHERGMLSSVMAGVGSLDSSVDAFFLLPVDVPLINPKTIEAVSKAFCCTDSMIIHPCFQGRRGHPPLISTACIPKDLSTDYPGGLRAFLARYETKARDVEVADEAILMDCDTPADYEKLNAYRLRECTPTNRQCPDL
jgi:molybdenum cofactor cytidylyltransferase